MRLDCTQSPAPATSAAPTMEGLDGSAGGLACSKLAVCSRYYSTHLGPRGICTSHGIAQTAEKANGSHGTLTAGTNATGHWGVAACAWHEVIVERRKMRDLRTMPALCGCCMGGAGMTKTVLSSTSIFLPRSDATF